MKITTSVPFVLFLAACGAGQTPDQVRSNLGIEPTTNIQINSAAAPVDTDEDETVADAAKPADAATQAANASDAKEDEPAPAEPVADDKAEDAPKADTTTEVKTDTTTVKVETKAPPDAKPEPVADATPKVADAPKPEPVPAPAVAAPPTACTIVAEPRPGYEPCPSPEQGYASDGSTAFHTADGVHTWWVSPTKGNAFTCASNVVIPAIARDTCGNWLTVNVLHKESLLLAGGTPIPVLGVMSITNTNRSGVIVAGTDKKVRAYCDNTAGWTAGPDGEHLPLCQPAAKVASK